MAVLSCYVETHWKWYKIVCGFIDLISNFDPIQETAIVIGSHDIYYTLNLKGNHYILHINIHKNNYFIIIYYYIYIFLCVWYAGL